MTSSSSLSVLCPLLVLVVAVVVALIGIPDDMTVLKWSGTARKMIDDTPGVAELRQAVFGVAPPASRRGPAPSSLLHTPPTNTQATSVSASGDVSSSTDTTTTTTTTTTTGTTTATTSPAHYIRPIQNPVADPGAVVVSPDGVARFTVLTSRLVRMEYARDGVFEDAATFAFINRNLAVPEYSQSVLEVKGHSDKQALVIKTEHLQLQYVFDPSLGPATTGDDSGEDESGVAPPFTPATLSVKVTMEDGKTVLWRAGAKNPGRLFGTLRTLDTTRGAMTLDCEELPPRLQYGDVSQLCTYGIVSRSGWAVVDDTLRPRFDNDPEWPWVQDPPSRQYVHQPSGTAYRFDWYLFGHGHDYKGALGDFVQVAGRIAMPPRYGFGVYFSRWWPFSDHETMDIVQEYQSYSIPLDIMVTDMDWHVTCYKRMEQRELDQAGEQVCWTGHSWDHKYFPDPKAFFDWCDARGIKNTFNLHLSAGVQPHETGYPPMAESMGIDPDTQKYVPFNIVNKTYAVNYHKHLLKPIEDLGLDFWWLDWQQGEDWFSEKRGYSLPNAVHPTWILNYVFSTQPARFADGKRPMILHRWGGLGCHRFPVGFSGDVYPNWESFAYQPYFTSTAANVGFGYWSHDIGGFMLPAGGELYTRWIQFGALSPVFRTHGSRVAENIKRVWHYDVTFFKAMRAAMQLRSQLLPYMYTAARRAYDTGVSIVSPLYYYWPDLEDAYTRTTQYMFGEDLMVVPVTKKMVKSMQLARNVEVWFPPGEWISWFTGQVVMGPTAVNSTFTINEFGLYVKSGSVVVTKLVGDGDIQDDLEATRGREWLGRAQDIPQTLVANVFLPQDFDGESFTGDVYHYEDDGDSQAYVTGLHQWTRMAYTLTDDSVVFTVHAAEGTHPKSHAARSYSVRLHACVPPTSVTVNGQPVAQVSAVAVGERRGANTWHYDGTTMAVTMDLFTRFDVSKDVVVEVALPAGGVQATLRPAMNGLIGVVNRAKTLKPLLDNNYPKIYPEDYDHVSLLSEVGHKASYNPDTVPELVDGFQAQRKLALAQVKALTRVSTSVKKTAKAHLKL